jgi:hypothetical protein
MPDYTVKADVDSMLRADNDAGIRSAIGLGQTDAPTFLAQTLTGQSLTGTQATSLVDLATTWLSTTGTPTAIKLNVTDTASNAASKLMDLQVGLVSVFSVSKTGLIQCNSAGASFPGGVFAGGSIGGGIGGSTVSLANNTGAVTVGSNGEFSFSTTTNASSGARDTILVRDGAAGILAQRNGTAKQVHRVYNTFLGTTANEWGGFDWLTTANTLRIGTEHGGTGTARPIDFVVGGVVVAGLTSTALTSTNSIVGKLGTTASPSFSFAGRTDSGMFSFSSTEITLVIGGVNALRLQTGICTVNSGNIGVGGGFDANLSRIAGSSLAIGNGTLGDFSGSLKLRNVIQSPGVATIVTPASNGDLVFETTSNTSVTVKLKGSDGTVRSVVLTLA